MADILVLSLIAGLVVAGGLWMATRDTGPSEPHSKRGPSGGTVD